MSERKEVHILLRYSWQIVGAIFALGMLWQILIKIEPRLLATELVVAKHDKILAVNEEKWANSDQRWNEIKDFMSEIRQELKRR